MPDEQAQQLQSNEERTQHLIDYLGELWRRPHEPSPETLKRVTEFVMGLPEEYRAMGLKAIAEHLVNNMSLHILDVVATFQKEAEQEGIDAEEREGTLEDVMPETFQTLTELSGQVSVKSMSDLVNLSNITIGLYGLYQVDSAEDAQSVMYTLPLLYREQLTQRSLILHLTSKEVAHNPPLKPPVVYVTKNLEEDKSQSILGLQQESSQKLAGTKMIEVVAATGTSKITSAKPKAFGASDKLAFVA